MSTISSSYPYGRSLAPPRGSDRPGGSALGGSATARLRDGLAALATGIARTARARRDMRRLLQMDDRALRDIGLARAEIERAVYGGRW